MDCLCTWSIADTLGEQPADPGLSELKIDGIVDFVFGNINALAR